MSQHSAFPILVNATIIRLHNLARRSIEISILRALRQESSRIVVRPTIVNATQAEYWDAPAGWVAKTIGFVKAVTTGERENLTENAKLNLR